MAKLPRQNHKIFGNDGTTDNFTRFGSKTAGAPVQTKDIEDIQSLAAWDDGWQEAVFPANKAPFIEDMNALLFEHSYQTGYLFQEGIPEWSNEQTYFINSIVKRDGSDVGAPEYYASLVDNNLNNALPVKADNANWKWLNPPTPDVPNVGNSLKANLQMLPFVGSPGTTVQITADILSVQNVSLSAVSVTANMSILGAGGLDTGAPAANTWYAVHAITNADGTLVNALLSLSATAPTLPSGYTKFRRLGWVRSTAVAGNIQQQVRLGDVVHYVDPNWNTITNPPAVGVVSFAASVPTTSRAAKFAFSAIGTGGSAPQPFVTVKARTPGSATYIPVGNDTGEDTGSSHAQGVFEWLLSTTQGLDIQITASHAVSTRTFAVTAYADPV